jgi:hypothetical protein
MSDKLMLFNISVTTLAIILAPLIAIQVSKRLERRREARERMLSIFFTLMAYRRYPTHFETVRALNMIDTVFNSKDN